MKSKYLTISIITILFVTQLMCVKIPGGKYLGEFLCNSLGFGFNKIPLGITVLALFFYCLKATKGKYQNLNKLTKVGFNIILVLSIVSYQIF